MLHTFMTETVDVHMDGFVLASNHKTWKGKNYERNSHCIHGNKTIVKIPTSDLCEC